MTALYLLIPVLGVADACDALALPRATFYRWQRPTGDKSPRTRPPPELALSDEERQKVLDHLHSDEFVDMAPHAIFATLLDRGTYLCSIRTMYRILAVEGEVRERRNQLRHPKYQRPELLATKPNELWTWDITKLRAAMVGSYYQLYVIIDVFSRYVTGWTLAFTETGQLATELIQEACRKQNILPRQLTIHADNGAAMTSKSVTRLLADLDVIKSHSRPYCSDDNPFSESQFKTLKYRPEFPTRFGSFEDALGFCRDFFDWYNKRHYHSGIASLHPEDLHYGRALPILEQRNQVMNDAFERFPERFKGKPPRPIELPQAVWINPPFKTKNQ